MTMNARQNTNAPRYTRRLRWTRHQWKAAIVGFTICALLVASYAFYLRSSDVAPDSPLGYGFAIAGTLLLAIVGVGYVIRKRVRRHWSGLLNAALSWHIVGGILGLALILVHAVGNFHPRTGTYALYSLLALVASGLIGKLIDRTSPHLAAKAGLKTLNDHGEERLDALVNDLSARQRVRRNQQRSPSPQDVSETPWDLAYYDLDTTPHQIPELLQRTPEIAASMSGVATGGALAAKSEDIRRAIDVEAFYLHVIRFWRRLHVALSVLTLVLILWHLEYACSLLLGAR